MAITQVDKTDDSQLELDRYTVKAIIEKLAKSNSLITYDEMAKTVGKMRNRAMSPQGFGGPLSRIQNYCNELGLPALSAMAVDKTMKPGKGFAEYYKSIHPDAIDMSADEIAHMEQKACIAQSDWQQLYDHVGLDEAAPKIKDLFAEHQNEPVYKEGKRVARCLSEEVERNPQARVSCLALKGHRCIVCEQDLEEVYGVSGIIHIHHLKPLFESVGEREVDPEKDLVPVCPNCHAVIHSKGGRECYTPNEVREMLGLEPLESY